LLHVLVAKAAGFHTIVMDSIVETQSRASAFGADLALDVEAKNNTQEIAELTDNMGVDAAVIIRGREHELKVAIECVRRGGTIVLFASYAPSLIASVDINSLHSKEISLVGTTGQSLRDFAEAARLISNRVIDVQGLISKEYSLDKIRHALDRAISPDTFRVIVKS